MQSAVPEIEAGRTDASLVATSSQDEGLMAGGRREIDNFAKEHTEIYEARSVAAAHERILITSGIDLLCAVVAVLMIGSSCYSFVVCDLAGNILITNPACETLTGWSAAEAVGQRLSTVFSISAEGNAKRRKQNAAYRSKAEAILFGTPERSTLTARDGTPSG